MKQRTHFQLNEKEKVIGSSDVASLVFDRGGFVLTNQRVIKVERSRLGGDTCVHTISLENLDSIQVHARKWWILIFVAAVLLIVAAGQESGSRTGYYVGAALAVILFFVARWKYIRLASGNSEMYLNVHFMAHEAIQELVFSVEEAKQARLEGLQKDPRPGAPVPEDHENRLRRLEELRERGMVTEDEYRAKRQKILDEI